MNKVSRNKILALTRQSKKLYYLTYFSNDINNMKKTWAWINEVMNWSKLKSKPCTALRRLTCHEITHNLTEFLNVLTWFSSYLANRTKTTQIDSNLSRNRNSVTGGPQGSVLGPLIFLIYASDIYTCSDKLRFYLFADDTNLLYSYFSLRCRIKASSVHNVR